MESAVVDDFETYYELNEMSSRDDDGDGYIKTLVIPRPVGDYHLTFIKNKLRVELYKMDLSHSLVGNYLANRFVFDGIHVTVVERYPELLLLQFDLIDEDPVDVIQDLPYHKEP